jgi:hypothetical protein
VPFGIAPNPLVNGRSADAILDSDVNDGPAIQNPQPRSALYLIEVLGQFGNEFAVLGRIFGVARYLRLQDARMEPGYQPTVSLG